MSSQRLKGRWNMPDVKSKRKRGRRKKKRRLKRSERSLKRPK
jgi:hypothetical protein